MPTTNKRNLIFLILFFGAGLVTIGVFTVYMLFVFNAGDRSLSLGDAVAVVDVVGEIYYDRNKVDEIEGYIDDDNVKAVVVYINSPGGGVAASQVLYHAVAQLRQHKPVVVVVMSPTDVLLLKSFAVPIQEVEKN